MKHLLTSLLISFTSAGVGMAQAAPSSTSGNVSDDMAGALDTRLRTYGTADAVQPRVPHEYSTIQLAHHSPMVQLLSSWHHG